MVLKAIVANKRLELDAKYPNRQIESLEKIPKSDRSLEAALRKDHTGFIFECKKASPSKGLIRADFDPAAIAQEYAQFADAISVLTDEKYFQGRLAYLSAVRAVVSVPVLCKDFILEPFQIVTARKAGADAILLMMSVLTDDDFKICFEMANRLDIDALVEVRNESELERAVQLGARIIGINNRNLDDLSVDLCATEKLAAKVPKDKVIISESGIETNSDVQRLKSLVNGFLVGSSLMSKPNITRACGELVYGRIKVCGLTRHLDAQAVAKEGVSYGGLIFAPKSKRVITLAQAQAVRENVPLQWVGVFVDAPMKEVVGHARALQLHAVQLHGKEDAQYIAVLAAQLNGVEIWKAVGVTDSVPPTNGYGDARILYDGKQGGSGQPFNWSLLKNIDITHCVVAGGLGVENATEVSQLGAFALDVNSQIEDAPGIKNIESLRAFLQNVRG